MILIDIQTCRLEANHKLKGKEKIGCHAPKSIVGARDVVSKRCSATEGWLVDIRSGLRVSEATDGEALDPSFLSIRYVSCFPS